MCGAIYDHLEAGTLYAVVRVCHTWPALGMRLLWQEVSGPALVSQPRFEGLDCSAFIRRIDLFEGELDDVPLDQWTFPRVQHLSIGPRDLDSFPSKAVLLLDCCGLSLASFRVECSPCDRGFFSELDIQVRKALAQLASLVDVQIDIGIGLDDDKRDAITSILTTSGVFPRLKHFSATVCQCPSCLRSSP